MGVRAPGRVNLIGEHTDYQEGFVMPIAIEQETFVVARINTRDDLCRVVSAQQGEVVETFRADVNTLVPGEQKWFKYVQGVVYEFLHKELAKLPVAFDAAFASNVPLGGGLSSSASLEVATAKMLQALYKVEGVSGNELAMRCVRAEHTFAKMPCGIMDQFASALSKKGAALFLDCRSEKVQHVVLEDPSVAFVIANSNAPHVLTGSEYPDRVKQCKSAVDVVRDGQDKPETTIKALRDISLEELEKHKDSMELVAYKRAKHVISENLRVEKAVDALQKRDYPKFGMLMVESHKSLRDFFEVSTKQLDLLVDIAMEVEGVFGSRMTGGGFGGCTVTLVKASAVSELVRALESKYEERSNGIQCTCFTTSPAQGAEILWS